MLDVVSDAAATLTRSFRALVNQGAETKEFARSLFAFEVAKVGASDPDLAAILRPCAIPRRLNADVIGVLRGATDEADRITNDRLMAALAATRFVSTLPDGSSVYDDATREALLEEWQSDEQSAEFERLSGRLVAHYVERHRVAQRLETELGHLAQLIQDASRARFIQLASFLEARVLASLLEAVYHETRRSAEAGYDLASRYYLAYEAQGRVNVCSAILSALTDYLKRLPPDNSGERWLPWVRYWEARLARLSRSRVEAEQLFGALLDEPIEDDKLKLWVLGDYASILHEQYKLGDALRFYRRELDLAEESNADPFNLPTSYIRIGHLHFVLGDLASASTVFREATDVAHAVRNFPLQVHARLHLSGVLQEQGSWEAAVAVTVEAFHLGRTSLSANAEIQRAIASQFMNLMARSDPRLVDTAFAEATALLPELGDRLMGVELDGIYAGALRLGGQLRRAESCLAELRKRLAVTDGSYVTTEVLFAEALLREDQGRLDDAVVVYDEIIRRAEANLGTSWHRAASTSNRGMAKDQLGRLDEACADLDAARADWKALGNERLEAFVRVALANVRRRQGRFATAQKLFDRAAKTLVETQVSLVADFHHAQADLYRDQARWTDAADQYRKAVTLNASIERHRDQARNASAMAMTAASQGEWKEATHHANQSSKLLGRLATADRYAPSEAATEADRENARGMKLLVSGASDRRHDAQSARHSFRTATERVPSNVWYWLNLAYACRELGDWREADQAMERVLRNGPEWLRAPLHRLTGRGGTMKRFDGDLSTAAPEGWSVKQSITLLDPTGRSNVIASSEPIEPTVDARQFARVQGDVLAQEFPGYHEVAFEPFDLDGDRHGYLRHFEWTPPDGVRVVQLQMYYTENGRGYTVTATAPVADFGSREYLLREMIGNLVITPERQAGA